MFKCLMLILCGFTMGVVAAAAPPPHFLSEFAACPNALPQTYSTTTHHSTVIQGVTYSFYTSADCSGTPANTPASNRGNLTLTSPTGTFFYCSDPSGSYNLITTACDITLPAFFQSVKITSITTDAGTLTANGNCITIDCPLGNFVSWSFSSTSTMTL